MTGGEREEILGKTFIEWIWRKKIHQRKLGGLESFFFFKYLFIFERERRGRERGGGQKIQSRLHAISAEPSAGLRLSSREIIT